MTKTRIRLLMAVPVLGLAVSMLGIVAAPAGAAATPSPQAGPDIITDGTLQNVHSGYYVQTHGHNNIVTFSDTGKSYLSQINCVEFNFPYGTHPACELRNESGLCLDAAPSYGGDLTAESCVKGDSQEEWWASKYGSPDLYWMINAWWSQYMGSDQYMTEVPGWIPGSPVQVDGAGYGTYAVWAYP
jgi:hypothetical protein